MRGGGAAGLLSQGVPPMWLNHTSSCTAPTGAPSWERHTTQQRMPCSSNTKQAKDEVAAGAAVGRGSQQVTQPGRERPSDEKNKAPESCAARLGSMMLVTQLLDTTTPLQQHTVLC